MNERPNVVSTGKSEADIAEEFKHRAQETLKPFLVVMSQARAAGLALQFDGIQMDAFGRPVVLGLRVVKVY